MKCVKVAEINQFSGSPASVQFRTLIHGSGHSFLG
jgi:hypothetical protein